MGNYYLNGYYLLLAQRINFIIDLKSSLRYAKVYILFDKKQYTLSKI